MAGAGSNPINLAARAKITSEVIERYRRKVFDWRGSATCIHLARAQMRAMGHRPPAIPQFRSALSAHRALKATGFDDLAALLDSMLPRISPAAMLVGDLAILPGDDAFDSIVIGAGGKMMGWHTDTIDRGIMPLLANPDAFIGAWRL